MVTARKQVQLTTIVWRVIARWTQKLLSQAFDSFFEHVTKQLYEKMCTKMMMYWCKLKLFVPFNTWCENTLVSKNVRRNRLVKKGDEHLLHKVLDSGNTHLSRFQSSPGLTADGTSTLMHLLEIRWLQLVDEYYDLAHDSVFRNGRAITWAEFEKRSQHHAESPMMIFDHRAGVPIVYDSPPGIKERKNSVPFKDHWVLQAKREEGSYASIQTSLSDPNRQQHADTTPLITTFQHPPSTVPLSAGCTPPNTPSAARVGESTSSDLYGAPSWRWSSPRPIALSSPRPLSTHRPSSVPENENHFASARPISGNNVFKNLSPDVHSPRSRSQRTPPSARGSGEVESRLDSHHHTSIFGSVIQALAEVAQVKKSDPTYWIRELLRLTCCLYESAQVWGRECRAVIDASMHYTFDHCGCGIMSTMKYVILQGKDHAKLKAYCRHMEQLDDEMLLRSINNHATQRSLAACNVFSAEPFFEHRSYAVHDELPLLPTLDVPSCPKSSQSTLASANTQRRVTALRVRVVTTPQPPQYSILF